MRIIQQILNWFGVALLVFAAGAAWLAHPAPMSATFVLWWVLPLLGYLLAVRPGAGAAVRTLALAGNWLAAVLAASLAGVALVGAAGLFPLFPLLSCAAILSLWNSVGLAAISLR